jgi:hypothetical protein
MKKNLLPRPALALAALLPALALLTGCVAALVAGGVAAGAGGVAYVNGELKSVESAPLDKAWKATQTAVQDLEFTVIDKHKDGLQAELRARTATDKKVRIKLEKAGESVTDIRIRVGTFGDESLSRGILDKIKQKL